LPLASPLTIMLATTYHTRHIFTICNDSTAMAATSSPKCSANVNSVHDHSPASL